MRDFKGLRDKMVKEQLTARGISDKRVLNAMAKIPREHFFRTGDQDFAYDDGAFPVGCGQTISQPYIVAVMTELLELERSEKVLEIGTGSGYQAAVLAELAKEVYSIERIPELANDAKNKLSDIGYKNIEIVVKDGTAGLLEKGPFDAIIVTAAAPKVPQALIDQLSDEGGRLVIPVGDRFSQILKKIKKYGGELIEERSIPCIFVPLIGQDGWRSA